MAPWMLPCCLLVLLSTLVQHREDSVGTGYTRIAFGLFAGKLSLVNFRALPPGPGLLGGPDHGLTKPIEM